MENLVAIAQSAHGSVANVNSIKSDQVESGFAQSDVTYWAYTGTGPFKGKEPIKKLWYWPAFTQNTYMWSVARDVALSRCLILRVRALLWDSSLWCVGRRAFGC